VLTAVDRAKNIRRRLLRMAYEKGGQAAHLGGALSIVDLMAELFTEKMAHDPANPLWEDRDRLILSKGHACLALYATLEEFGYPPGNYDCGHPIRQPDKGIEFST